MSEGTVRDDGRYWAFISYSHKDAAFGRRLHRRLESYALPRRLVGRAIAQGAVPRRLAPIFRDRDEFPAAKDLSAEVRAALSVSRSLIVVCSPTAALSPWVAREIELFHALHPDRPILAAIRDGDPHDCFPEALRRTGPGGAQVEPLAADFRRGHDGWELGLLKLVAGVLELGLDELVQRDGQRKTQRVTAITAAALVLVLVMSVLTAYAISARNEAERQRTEAEGLVEFMLTDLRTTLKGVGRLDAMTAVNRRALDYYGHQDLSALPAESLERRARILHAMGEDDETEGDHDAALKKFREARRTTAALLAESHDDPERIFNHAQSEYWFGYVAYNRSQFASAKSAFLEYKRLIDRLVTIAPDNAKYQEEASYADGNLCSMALKPPRNAAAALKLCSTALSHMEAAARILGRESRLAEKLINRHGWLADAYRASGDLGRAKAERLAEERLLDRLIAADPKNADFRDTWISLQRAYALLEMDVGRFAIAHARLKRAHDEITRLINLDPANRRWIDQLKRIESDLVVTSRAQNSQRRN
ncbi:MAG TPA: toll/interleukin-1 receptor domain-containing protein [Rhizomicrobium sp.]